MKLVPDLLFLCNHGKRSSLLLNDADNFKKNNKKKRDQNGGKDTRLSLDVLVDYIKDCKVPKAWFLHMYLFAIANVAYCLYHQDTSLFITAPKVDMVLVYLALLGLHCCRRAYECVFVFNFGHSKMHLASYTIGLVHYLFTPWTLMTSQRQLELQALSIMDYSAFICYSVGMVSQHYFHRVLASPNKGDNTETEKEKTSKKSNKEGRVYIFPSGFGFNMVCCPHYTSEILIYVSFCLMDPKNTAILCLLIWVMSNLAVVSDDTYKWYCTEFPEEVKKKSVWNRLVPFLY